MRFHLYSEIVFTCIVYTLYNYLSVQKAMYKMPPDMNRNFDIVLACAFIYHLLW